ncbi:MAG: OmpA family protein [Pseudomonadales bacterium]|nr:OmpA family protein [Pseudomonadales bacterium]
MHELEDEISNAPPIWAIFGDLMSGLVGVFVLLLVWTMAYQLELTQSLEQEIVKREAEQERRIALEEALAGPLATGRITMNNGRIGISGNVLFSSNSSKLQPQGHELLKTLVEPLKVFLSENDQLLMISGFTDDKPIQKGNRHFNDNWQLSAERALTVTRTLINEGMPPSLVFAAAFGSQQPVVPNTDKQSRSQNRRVEMAPVPKTTEVNNKL